MCFKVWPSSLYKCTPDTFSTRLAGFYPNVTSIQSLKNALFLLYPVALIGAFTNKTPVCLPGRNFLSQCERFTIYRLMKSYLASSNNRMLLKTPECWINCQKNMPKMLTKHYFMAILYMRNTIFWNWSKTLRKHF